MENNLYEIALQEIEDEEDYTVLLFKTKYKLESGFYKKNIEFFYWLYKREQGNASTAEFKKSFLGRMVKFDKKNIPNYPELVFEYEKEKHFKKIRTTKAKKNKLKRLSEAKQSKNDSGT